MSLQSGRMLSHYRLVEKIGEGGMGVVWKALDTTLGREVAVKVLPDLFARDAERLSRFEREAKLLASLNHPNIAAVYGLHEAEGARFLAMEMIGGEDLARRLDRGPLPLEDVLRIALQMAQGLEAAHESGVVHRDLKPANIQVTADGKVKILDFGLAKALAGESGISSADPSLSPTLAVAGTMAGVILGTAAYMSPEQAKGKTVDRRADIWAFGAVLYEMLTGSKLFDGETISDMLASVLKTDPDWNTLPAGTPHALRVLLARCLEKDPLRRLRDIGDARIVLEEILSGKGDAQQPAPAEAAPVAKARSGLVTAVAVLGVAILAAAATWMLLPAPPEGQPYHLEVTVSGDLPLLQIQGSAAVLSPDGRYLAYVTGSPSDVSATRLHVRYLGRLEETELTGATGAYNPFFSPDGQWVGFVTPTELKKVSITGGTPLVLCAVSLSRGATWGDNGMIVFAPTPNGGLMQIPAAGGAPSELTGLSEGEVSHRWPQFLPGGKKVLFTSYTSGDRNAGRIEVVDVDTGARTVLQQGGTYGRYVSSGHLLYINSGTMFAAPLDLGSMKPATLPAPVLQGISSSVEGGAQYDVSRNGTIVYLTGQVAGARNTMVWTDPGGRMSPVSSVRREYQTPRLSPDGKRIAVVIVADGNSDVWVHDLERDTQTRLTFDEARDIHPVWSPDGRYVYFTSNRGGTWGILRKRSDGSGEEESIFQSDDEIDVYSASPDGRFVAYHDQTTAGDAWILPVDGEKREPRRVFQSAAADGDPVFSPDGRWISYDSDESGRWEVYVRPVEGSGGKWQVSGQGGEFARWSDDSRWLFYRERSGGIWRVPVRVSSESIEAGRPEKLFEVPVGIQQDWDVSGDGTKFLFIQTETAVGDAGANKVKLALNWFAELRRLLATAR